VPKSPERRRGIWLQYTPPSARVGRANYLGKKECFFPLPVVDLATIFVGAAADPNVVGSPSPTTTRR
jgi:hypothetical protein